jgi:hypothetical protein
MTPLRLATLFVLAALVLLGVLLYRSGGDAPPMETTRLAGESGPASQTIEARPSNVTRGEADAAASSAPAVTGTAANPSRAEALRLRALDHEGRPLPIARFAVYAAQTWREQREHSEPLWTQAADAEGRASWSEAGAKLEEHLAAGGLVAMLDGFLPYLEPIALASTEALAREHELRAPPFGSVVVRVLTPLEEPVAKGSVRLVAWTGRGVNSGAPQEQRDHQRGMSIEEGVARFAYVGLGVPMRLTAYMLGGPQVEAEVSPLQVAGEVRTVIARLGSDRVILRLRLLDEEGRPTLGDTHVRMRMNAPGAFSSVGGTLTDHESVAWLDLPGEPPLPAELEIELTGHGNRNVGNASVKVQIAQARGLIDLGDVLLRRGPLAVSGRVLRPDGSPAVGAELRARWTDAKQGDGLIDTPSASLRIEDAEGSFAWYASRERATPETQVTLEASLQEKDQPGLVARRQRVALGTTDVELRLEAPGTIAATWREGAPWQPDDFEARLEPEDPTSPATHQQAGAVVPSGIRFLPQLAGRYTLRLSTPRGPLLQIQGLVIPAGAACDDPRLRDIDLGSQVTLLIYEITNPPEREGRPRGMLYARPTGEAGAPWTRREFRGEQARIALPRGRYDIAILAAGARLVRYSDVDQGQRVELEASLPVVLALEGRPEGLGAEEHLRARLELTLDGLLLAADSDRFDAQGLARAFLPAPGRYGVSWLRDEERGTQISTHTLDAESATVEAGAGPGEQRLGVTAPKVREKR